MHMGRAWGPAANTACTVVIMGGRIAIDACLGFVLERLGPAGRTVMDLLTTMGIDRSCSQTVYITQCFLVGIADFCYVIHEPLKEV